MPVLNHKHTYIRRDRYSYKCADPNCTHWMPRKELKDKASICSICRREEIILDLNVQLKLARPHCANCGNTKKDRLRRGIADKLKELGVA